MIPSFAITEWSSSAPWVNDKFIEQDLLICRALCQIYNDSFLSSHLAFRGGTALGKLFLSPQPRYSEDIDLVQVNPEPIKETLQHLRDALSFLGQPIIKQKKYNNTLVFRVQPTELGYGDIHLKVEINCKEHFSTFPMIRIPFAIESSWYSGKCEVSTYELEELTGTKMRALFQRRKGRDLFDLHRILTHAPTLDKDKVIQSFRQYLSFVAPHIPTYKEFTLNLEAKLQDKEYLSDTDFILGPGIDFNPSEAYRTVHDELLMRLE